MLSLRVPRHAATGIAVSTGDTTSGEACPKPAPPMKRLALQSSVIRSAGYDPSRHTLEIEFTSGHIYDYYDVPRRLYRGLLTALSHGRYFDGFIRNAGFRFRQIM